MGGMGQLPICLCRVPGEGVLVPRQLNVTEESRFQGLPMLATVLWGTWCGCVRHTAQTSVPVPKQVSRQTDGGLEGTPAQR